MSKIKGINKLILFYLLTIPVIFFWKVKSLYAIPLIYLIPGLLFWSYFYSPLNLHYCLYSIITSISLNIILCSILYLLGIKITIFSIYLSYFLLIMILIFFSNNNIKIAFERNRINPILIILLLLILYVFIHEIIEIYGLYSWDPWENYFIVKQYFSTNKIFHYSNPDLKLIQKGSIFIIITLKEITNINHFILIKYMPFFIYSLTILGILITITKYSSNDYLLSISMLIFYCIPWVIKRETMYLAENLGLMIFIYLTLLYNENNNYIFPILFSSLFLTHSSWMLYFVIFFIFFIYEVIINSLKIKKIMLFARNTILLSIGGIYSNFYQVLLFSKFSGVTSNLNNSYPLSYELFSQYIGTEVIFLFLLVYISSLFYLFKKINKKNQNSINILLYFIFSSCSIFLSQSSTFGFKFPGFRALLYFSVSFTTLFGIIISIWNRKLFYYVSRKFKKSQIIINNEKKYQIEIKEKTFSIFFSILLSFSLIGPALNQTSIGLNSSQHFGWVPWDKIEFDLVMDLSKQINPDNAIIITKDTYLFEYLNISKNIYESNRSIVESIFNSTLFWSAIKNNYNDVQSLYFFISSSSRNSFNSIKESFSDIIPVYTSWKTTIYKLNINTIISNTSNENYTPEYVYIYDEFIIDTKIRPDNVRTTQIICILPDMIRLDLRWTGKVRLHVKTIENSYWQYVESNMYLKQNKSYHIVAGYSNNELYLRIEDDFVHKSLESIGVLYGPFYIGNYNEQLFTGDIISISLDNTA